MDRAPMMRRVLVLLVGIVLGAVATWAHAAADLWPGSFAGALLRSTISGGTGTLGRAATMWPYLADGSGGVVFKGQQRLSLPGASALVDLSRSVTAANLARGARLMVGLSGAIGATWLVYEGITWAVDHWEKPGQDTAPVPGYRWFVVGGIAGSCGNNDPCPWADVIAAMTAVCAAQSGGPYDCTSEVNVYPQVAGQAYTVQMVMKKNGSYSGYSYSKTVERSNVGYTPSGVPATDAEVEAGIAAGLAANPNQAPGVAEKVLGYVPVVELAPGPLQASGPASVQGPVTSTVTVTNAGNQTDNRSVVYNVTYAGDVVTVTSTTTTTTTYPDSSTKTETETTTDSGNGGEEAPPEEKKLCDEFPDSSACAELGEHDQEPDLEEESRTLSWVPSLSAAGSCPAAQSFMVGGKSYQMAWTPVCDFATGLRPVVLAMAWLSAALFVFGVGRGAVS